jgi:hypothetical protein
MVAERMLGQVQLPEMDRGGVTLNARSYSVKPQSDIMRHMPTSSTLEFGKVTISQLHVPQQRLVLSQIGKI